MAEYTFADAVADRDEAYLLLHAAQAGLDAAYERVEALEGRVRAVDAKLDQAHAQVFMTRQRLDALAAVLEHTAVYDGRRWVAVDDLYDVLGRSR